MLKSSSYRADWKLIMRSIKNRMFMLESITVIAVLDPETNARV